MRRLCLTLTTTLLVLAQPGSLQAQYAPQHAGPYQGAQVQRFWYYPYYYFPHNYWPTLGPRYPEAPNQPYQRPPAYMAYPPFREPNWRYEYFSPQKYHRGHHFWLDQF
jgi:hypothetical protein